MTDFHNLPSPPRPVRSSLSAACSELTEINMMHIATVTDVLDHACDKWIQRIIASISIDTITRSTDKTTISMLLLSKATLWCNIVTLAHRKRSFVSFSYELKVPPHPPADHRSRLEARRHPSTSRARDYHSRDIRCRSENKSRNRESERSNNLRRIYAWTAASGTIL